MTAKIRRVSVVTLPIKIRERLSTDKMVPKRTWMRSTLFPFNETSMTPKARETRKNPAKLASSCNSVKRETIPAKRATKNPAKRPPRLIMGSESPEIKKPIATPGKMEWERASPIKLMRRRTRKTHTGADPSDKVKQAIKARFKKK